MSKAKRRGLLSAALLLVVGGVVAYATFGFSDKANLDEGAMWPTDFALTKLTATEEKGRSPA